MEALTIWTGVFLPHSNLQDISCSKLPELKLDICANKAITLSKTLQVHFKIKCFLRVSNSAGTKVRIFKYFEGYANLQKFNEV